MSTRKAKIIPSKVVPALRDATADMLNERGSRYGKFVDHADVTQRLKHVMRTHDSVKYVGMEPDQIEALEMIAHKIGRILNGDPHYGDSWRDIEGYARLVADRLEGVVR